MSVNQFIEIDDKAVTVVSKDFFVDGLILHANVYLRVRAGNYILIGKKGTVSTISTYHAVEKDGAQLYIRSSELFDVTSRNVAFTEKIMSADKVTTSVKVRYVNTLTESVMSDIERFGFGSSMESLKKISSFIQDIASQIDGLDSLLASLDNLPDNMARHSMSSALIALLIADEMNITLKTALEKIALGALLHDVGLREIPKEILEKPRRTWSPAEVQHYESHPLRGVELLRDIPQISSDVLMIINEHHENALGTGFPRHIRDIKMSPLSRIVALANHVTDLFYGSSFGTPAKNIDEIVEYIENVLGQPFNRSAFLGFKNLANKQNLINKIKKP